MTATLLIVGAWSLWLLVWNARHLFYVVTDGPSWLPTPALRRRYRRAM